MRVCDSYKTSKPENFELKISLCFFHMMNCSKPCRKEKLKQGNMPHRLDSSSTCAECALDPDLQAVPSSLSILTATIGEFASSTNANITTF
jgi:hypothetical protein